MDATKGFIICQIKESLETNEVLDLSSLTNRILLYNSLISLIVLPVEEIKKRGTQSEKNRLYQKRLTDLIEACNFSLEVFEPIAGFDKNTKRLKFNKKDMYAFMRKLRNSVAHQNVRFYEEDAELARITFFNLYTSPVQPSQDIMNELEKRNLKLKNKAVEDFRVSMSFESMRTLSDWIGSEYLRALEFEPERPADGNHEQN